MPKLPKINQITFLIFSSILFVLIVVIVLFSNKSLQNITAPSAKKTQDEVTPPILQLASYCDSSNKTYLEVLRPSPDYKYDGKIEYDNTDQFTNPIVVNVHSGEKSTKILSAYGPNTLIYLRVNSTVNGKTTDWSQVVSLRVIKC